jgi:trans-aconitate methyltransferase
MKCRFCSSDLHHVFLDLGAAPPSNAFLTAASLQAPELYFPLKLFSCNTCRLVQVDEVQAHTALFDDDYVYFSSYSSSWLRHAQRYVEHAADRLALSPDDLVMEIASNDGYLLQYVAARGIPCVGIEPTAGTAEAARSRGIETIGEFFGRQFAERFVAERRHASLIVANNVLAHVPNINDFVAGMAVALSPRGAITVEFPHLLELVTHCQFDTVYHEHFSYLSLHTVQAIFAAHGLEVWHVEQLTTHGGSLRVWAGHPGQHERSLDLARVLDQEISAGMLTDTFYEGFQEKADRVKNAFLTFLLEQRKMHRKVAGYGAAAKGNTLMNYAGVRPDLLPYVVDASPHKQGRWLPGTRIPVVDEERIRIEQPDVIVILPWNLREEIVEQLSYARAWGCQFATFVPELRVG